MASAVNTFLRKCADRLDSKTEPITVVMGNEGGDMDSVVGSLYLAMLFDMCPEFGFVNPVPVINFPAEDIPLRNDEFQLFQEVGLDRELLISTQESESGVGRCVKLDTNCSIVLYDHNKLMESQKDLGSCVVGILDHHFDEQLYKETTARLRTIRTVGSACTLVAELYRHSGKSVPCAMLLSAAIVIDTSNFRPEQKKVTPPDVEAYGWLSSQFDEEVDTDAFFKKLHDWKDDIFTLTVEQNLRRDYKHFSYQCAQLQKILSTGIASVPCSYPKFQKHYNQESIFKDCLHFFESRNLDALLMACAGKVNGEHTRHVCFFAPPKTLRVFEDFAASSPGGCTFTIIDSISLDGDKKFLAYVLSDSSVSRKRLAPALAEFLASGTSSEL